MFIQYNVAVYLLDWLGFSLQYTLYFCKKFSAPHTEIFKQITRWLRSLVASRRDVFSEQNNKWQVVVMIAKMTTRTNGIAAKIVARMTDWITNCVGQLMLDYKNKATNATRNQVSIYFWKPWKKSHSIQMILSISFNIRKNKVVRLGDTIWIKSQ